MHMAANDKLVTMIVKVTAIGVERNILCGCEATGKSAFN